MYLYKTIPVRSRVSDEEELFWLDQCQHANNLESLVFSSEGDVKSIGTVDYWFRGKFNYNLGKISGNS